MTDAEQDLEMVKKAAEKLGEHFDTVQILTTRHESGKEGGTVNINFGVGNWFARYGLARDWIVRCERDTEISREDRQ